MGGTCLAIACSPRAVLWFAATARAQAVADFYRGKTITLMVASGAGGGYDFFARALARHMGKHIPGNPTLIVQNMPGAGGARMVNFVYNVGAQDGTVLGVPLAPTAMAQVLDPDPINYDATRINWIGNLENSVGILFVWHGSPTRSTSEAMTRVTPLAGSASSATYQLPVLANALLNKFNVILGYPGAPDMENAEKKRRGRRPMAIYGRRSRSRSRPGSRRRRSASPQSVLERSPQLPQTRDLRRAGYDRPRETTFEYVACRTRPAGRYSRRRACRPIALQRCGGPSTLR